MEKDGWQKILVKQLVTKGNNMENLSHEELVQNGYEHLGVALSHFNQINYGNNEIIINILKGLIELIEFFYDMKKK